MHFLVLATDATDPDALARRMAARGALLAHMAEAKANGWAHMGAAILDDAGKMIGSVCIADFPSRAELDTWLAQEPYIVGKVWEKIEIKPCQIGPSFQK